MFSRDSAQNQMNFQQNMSGSAHQREVADLRAAGLNPILSALGSGSSTPSGATAEMGNMGEGISTGISTALGVQAQKNDNELKEAQVYQTHADTGLAGQKQKSEIASGYNIMMDTKKKNVEMQMAENELKMFKQTMPYLIKQAKASGDWAQVNQFMGVLKSGASSASDIKDLANPLKIKGK
ncbi:MAG: DNA pilot protein [Microviridae sp.]|nr:MAG: DNA pilot protein [Microviridae sp.]